VHIIHVVSNTMAESADSDPYAEVNEDASIEGFDASFIETEGISDRVDGIRTRYYEYGEGPPLVLLHGGNWSGTSSANTWSRVIEKLADRFRVLAPDRLGCGMTQNPEDKSDYVYASELEHAISFINTMGVEEFHICGQSRGGGLAGRVAAEIPDRTKSLTIVNSGTLSPPAGDKEYFKSRALRDAPSDEDSPTYHADYYKHYYSLHEYSPDHVTDEFAMAAGYMATRDKARQAEQVLDDENRQKIWRETLEDHMDTTHRRMKDGKLQMPTLIFWGRNDRSRPLHAGIALYEIMAKRNPRVEMHIINKAGHHPYREYPEKFAHRLVSMVDFHEEHGYDYGEPATTYERF
jgi:pimeloyl-ACP methyl ester carboxylesterase